MIFIFWMLSFKPAFSLSSFTFIRRLFSSSLLYAIRVVSSELSEVIDIFPSNLDSSLYFILAFHMMYSAYKLNKQGDNIQPYSFLNFERVCCSCTVLTVASWPAYRFRRRQVRWSGISISWRIFQFVAIHTVKGFSAVNEAEVDVFPEFFCFFYDPTDVGKLISGSSSFSKSSSYIWKFLVHVLWSLAWRILSITLLAYEMSAIVW